MLQHIKEKHRKKNNRVKIYPPDEVTTISKAEVEAAAGGMEQKDIEAIWQSVVGCYNTGLQPAISLCMRRHGEVILDRAIGHASGNAPQDPDHAEKVLATPDTLFNLYSASKSITAMLIHLLDERGIIHLDDRIAEYIPAFGNLGKEKITIRHVLMHKAGCPQIPPEFMELDMLSDWDTIVQKICEAPIQMEPGRWLAYHALSGGFILAVLIHKVTGMDIRQFLQQEILDPLGFKHLNYGVPATDTGLVALNATTNPPPVWPLSAILKRVIGVSMQDAVDLSNDPRFLTSIVPSANIIGTANEASRFYELMLREGTLDGTQIFEPRTVRRAREKQTHMELDFTLLLPVPYAMGFMLGANIASFYGPNTPQAFGHLGLINIVTYCDPARDISVGLMTTGKPFLTPKLLGWYNIVHSISNLCPQIG